MATQPWLSLRFPALGAAGHGTGMQGVSDRVEVTPGEPRKRLARFFPNRATRERRARDPHRRFGYLSRETAIDEASRSPW